MLAEGGFSEYISYLVPNHCPFVVQWERGLLVGRGDDYTGVGIIIGGRSLKLGAAKPST